MTKPHTVDTRPDAPTHHRALRLVTHPATRDVGASLLLTYAVTFWVLKIWKMHLHRPFQLNGDSIWYAAHIKGFLPDTNHWSNPLLGSPFGQNMADFPLGANNLNWVIIRAIGWFDGDWAAVYNLFFLATFGLSAAVAVLILRRWQVHSSLAVALSVLYATAPYHFQRGEFHVFLAAYWMVPVGCHMALRHFDEHPFLDIRKSTLGALIRQRRTWLIMLSAIALGSTGPYYSLWSAMIIIVAGALAARRHSSMRHLLSGLTIALVITGTMFVNLAPTLISKVTDRPNPAALGRAPFEADAFGLRIVNLFSPVPGHRIDRVNRAFDTFSQTPIPSEGSDHLGLVAAIGLAAAIVAALGATIAGPDRKRAAVSQIGALSLFIMISASIGGLSWYVRAAGLPQLRAWNRLSIFLSFFALLTVGLLLSDLSSRMTARWQSFTSRPWMAPLLLAAIALPLGAFDQTTAANEPKYEAGAAALNQQLNFWVPIEATLGDGADVFQFPVVPFPEQPQIADQNFYEHLLPYLATKTLRFSSGGMKGRDAEWQNVLDRDDPDLVMGLLHAGGFDAVTVDRLGYTDRGKRVEALLTDSLGAPRWVSDDGRQVVYDMRAFNGGALIDPAPDFKADAHLASMMQVEYVKGQWSSERSRNVPARWLRPRATIRIDNPTNSTVDVSFRSELDMVSPGTLQLVDSETGAEIAMIDVPSAQTPMDLSLSIPSGGLTIDLISTAPTQNAPGDFRSLGVYLTEPLVLPLPFESLANG